MTRREALLAAVALPAASKVTATVQTARAASSTSLVWRATTGWIEMPPQDWTLVRAAFIPTPQWTSHWQAVIAGDDE